jgi:two-component system response regulator NreC
LILTVHAQERYLFRVLRAGAAGYLNKTVADAELVNAVRIVATGGAFLQPGDTRRLLEDLVTRVQAGEEPDRYDRLSEREREVLRLVATGHTAREIAEHLSLSPKTVETYRARIMEKLELSTRAELVRYALRRGVLTEDL